MTRWFSDRDHQILTAILLLALGLRIWGLNAPLWYDEITTVETHLRLPWDEMMTSYSMNHHYLYSLQAKLVTGLFGEAAWTVRLPAMLFGVGSIAAMWCLAKRVAGVRLAHITALLLALSFHHIWFSQNARGYTELAFWSTLGMIFFLDGMRDPKLKTWLAYAACLALAIATHLTGFFFFAAQGLIWLGFAVLNVRRLGLMADSIRIPALGYIVGGVAALIFYAPILSSVFEVTSAVAETSQVDVMQEYQNPLWSILEAFRTVLGSLGPVLGIIAAAVIALSIIGAARLHRQSPYFAPIVGLHIALTMALLLALGMRIWPRFFFVDIGFLMLLIIVGVYASCVWIRQIVTFVPPESRLPGGCGRYDFCCRLVSPPATIPRRSKTSPAPSNMSATLRRATRGSMALASPARSITAFTAPTGLRSRPKPHSMPQWRSQVRSISLSPFQVGHFASCQKWKRWPIAASLNSLNVFAVHSATEMF